MVDRRSWIRAVLAALALEQLVTGIWAVVDPLGWYRGFPGLGRQWVSTDGPFNHHLVVDAGSGFLAVGVLLLIAVLWTRREVTQVAFAAFLVEGIPHLLYHAIHPAELLSATDNVLSIGGLALMAAAAAVCLVAVSRSAHTGASRVGEEVPA
ncbi:MAG: hypothetical protein ACREQY_02585 [Candidatus Binatia bacterium]